MYHMDARPPSVRVSCTSSRTHERARASPLPGDGSPTGVPTHTHIYICVCVCHAMQARRTAREARRRDEGADELPRDSENVADARAWATRTHRHTSTYIYICISPTEGASIHKVTHVGMQLSPAPQRERSPSKAVTHACTHTHIYAHTYICIRLGLSVYRGVHVPSHI